MKGSFDYLVNNLDDYLQPCEWQIYIDLLTSKNNLKKFNEYDWYHITNDLRYKEIELYQEEFELNYSTILELVKEILLDNIKKDHRFEYFNENDIKVAFLAYGGFS